MLKEIELKKYVALYRSNLKSNNQSLEDYVNLILILWNTTYDYGFESYCITQEIFTKDEISNFPKEIDVLFNRAFSEFPDNKELQFWKIYFSDLSAYSECSHKTDMEDFLKTKDFYLPYFYMYVQCGIVNNKQLEKIKLNLTDENDSYKKHYILSFLSNIKYSTE